MEAVCRVVNHVVVQNDTLCLIAALVRVHVNNAGLAEQQGSLWDGHDGWWLVCRFRHLEVGSLVFLKRDLTSARSKPSALSIRGIVVCQLVKVISAYTCSVCSSSLHDACAPVQELMTLATVLKETLFLKLDARLRGLLPRVDVLELADKP